MKEKETNKNRILEALRKSKNPLTPSKAAEIAGVNKNTTRWCCLALLKEKKIKRVKRGYYKAVS